MLLKFMIVIWDKIISRDRHKGFEKKEEENCRSIFEDV